MTCSHALNKKNQRRRKYKRKLNLLDRSTKQHERTHTDILEVDKTNLCFIIFLALINTVVRPLEMVSVESSKKLLVGNWFENKV